MSKALEKLVQDNNARGLGKWVGGRKIPPVKELVAVIPALNDECLKAIAPALGWSAQADVVRRLLPSNAELAGRFLAAGCEFSHLILGLMTSPEHVDLFLRSGWDPALPTRAKRFPREWGWRDMAFHKALFDAGVPMRVEDLTYLIVERRERETTLEHFTLLCSYLPAGDAERSFPPIERMESLSDAAAVYLSSAALELALSLGAPPPKAPIGPAQPDAQAKIALLQSRGVPFARLSAIGFAKLAAPKPDELLHFLGPDYALGLFPGMSEADVEALGFSTRGSGNTSLEFDAQGLQKVSVDLNEAYGWDELSNALSAHFGPPTQLGPRSLWKTDRGELWIQCNAYYEAFRFVLQRGNTAQTAKAYRDLGALRRSVEDYLLDIGLDALGGQPRDIEVHEKNGELRVGYTLRGQRVFLSWSGPPCDMDGGLHEAFTSALCDAASNSDAHAGERIAFLLRQATTKR